MEEHLRLFIAITIPKKVKSALSDCCQQLSTQFPRGVVRWVRPEATHLTLRFLGDTAVSRVSSIIKQLDDTVDDLNPITLQLNQLGCFPNRKRPRVLWIGLRGEIAQLLQLKQTIDQNLYNVGWPLETRRYNPHLTIGRIKDSQKAARVKWGSEVPELHFLVTAVTLYQSELTPNGPIYTSLHTSKI